MLKACDILVYYAFSDYAIKKLHENKLFRTSIDFAHRGILKYDSDAFVYDDVRLQTISNTIISGIKIFFDNDPTLIKCSNIFIFLMKEDIYYRPRWIQILQDIREIVEKLNIDTLNIHPVLVCLEMVCKVCKEMTFTHIEIANIERWK
jgi:hypothetical protein